MKKWIVLGTVAGLAAIAFGVSYYVRKVQANFRTVIEGQVYRSGQPSKSHLEKWKREYGIKSVVSLRGSEKEEFLQEKAEAEELGLKIVGLNWSARRMPGVQGVEELLSTLEKMERPVLIHCAEGVDRSGVASAIAAMALGGQDFETAKKHIGSKYQSEMKDGVGVAGLFFQYEEYCQKYSRLTGGWKEFREWLYTVYKPS